MLRQLTDNEVEAGYAIYLEAFDWLKAKGVRQWLGLMPKAVYLRRQQNGENFGLFVDEKLAGILSLAQDNPSYWREEIGDAERWWLSTLALSRNFAGRKLGEKAVLEALALLGAKGAKELFLDCVDESDFLPSFYQKSGFAVLARKQITYPTGDAFPMVLMKCLTSVPETTSPPIPRPDT